jgi:hypothetical protein
MRERERERNSLRAREGVTNFAVIFLVFLSVANFRLLARSGKKKRLLNLQKGDKLHARMFKKKEGDKMSVEDE